MTKKINSGSLLVRIRKKSPLIHHLTNWVTVYDCAQAVKSLGASPVMAHAPEEVAQMSGIASSLVLNIGTLTTEFIESMKLAAKAANQKGIPVILDVCGAGATFFRDQKCKELINEVRIDIIKGNSSEIARVAGENVKTKGVDSSNIDLNIRKIAFSLASAKRCVVVVTGEEDIVTDGKRVYLVSNGEKIMSNLVGTGCMAASVIGAFIAVEKDLVKAAVSGLVCFEVAAELASKQSKGPASFRINLFDLFSNLKPEKVLSMQKIRCLKASIL